MKRLPKGDETICPHCGKILTHGNLVYNPTDAEVKKIQEANIQEEKKKHSISRLGYIAIVGLVFLGVGLGFVIIGFQSVPSLLGGMLSALIGTYILVGVAFSEYRASQRRIKRGEPETIYDAMSLWVGMPSWWQWWHAFIPFFALLILAGANIITPTEFWIIFIGSSGSAILYQYLAARRLVSMQDKRSSSTMLQARIPAYHRNYFAYRQAIKLGIIGGIVWAAERTIQSQIFPPPSEIRAPPIPLVEQVFDLFFGGFILAWVLTGIYIGTSNRLPTRSPIVKSILICIVALVVLVGSFSLLEKSLSYFTLDITYSLPSYLLLVVVIAFASKTKA